MEFLIFVIDIIKYLKSYDPKQESKLIVYLHANRLYGYVMSMFVPTNEFKWIDPKEFDLKKHTSNSSKDFALKVDLEYPKELRELHYDYPLAPDKIEIKREMLSDYQLKSADLYNIPNMTKMEKRCTNLRTMLYMEKQWKT